VAHSARVYDYLLGGKDNFAADREVGEQIIAAIPEAAIAARETRAFLGRAVRFLAADCGIRQFLDLGTGIPSAGNTHEVAQAIAPGARVMYVDNDPMVLAHARALLTGTAAGSVSYLDADLRDTGSILEQAARTLDFSQPVALMLLAVLHMIPDADDPYQIVKGLLDALPGGSYLAISHLESDVDPERTARVQETFNARTGPGVRMTTRSRAQVARFFDGLEVAEPGLVPASQWRADRKVAPGTPRGVWCAVARKPTGSVG
jgi:hypothetical protein